MPAGKDDKTQREKFEEEARRLEEAHGPVPDDALEALIGAAGEAQPIPEARARKKAGLPPASH